MVLSDATNIGLLEDVKFMCGTPEDFTDALIKRYLNEAYKEMTSIIIDSMDDWDFQGETSTADLVANQREYTFPTTILRIDRIEAMLDGTNWTTVGKLDLRKLDVPVASETDIVNRFSNAEPYYDPFDRSIFLYSGTISAVTGGLKIWYTGTAAELSGNSDTPVIEPPFHRTLSLYASKIWASKHDDKTLLSMITRELGERDAASGLYSGLIGRMQEYYAKRERTGAAKIAAKSENYE